MAAAGVLHGQSIYGMVQGGMPYVHTHESTIRILKNYEDANGKMNGLAAKLLVFIMNSGIKKDLKSKGIDYKAESPYRKSLQ